MSVPLSEVDKCDYRPRGDKIEQSCMMDGQIRLIKVGDCDEREGIRLWCVVITRDYLLKVLAVGLGAHQGGDDASRYSEGLSANDRVVELEITEARSLDT